MREGLLKFMANLFDWLAERCTGVSWWFYDHRSRATTTAAVFLPTEWGQCVSNAIEARASLADLVNRQFETEMSCGEVLNIQDEPYFPWGSGVGRLPTDWPTVSGPITINREAYVGIMVDEEADMTRILQPFMDGPTE